MTVSSWIEPPEWPICGGANKCAVRYCPHCRAFWKGKQIRLIAGPIQTIQHNDGCDKRPEPDQDGGRHEPVRLHDTDVFHVLERDHDGHVVLHELVMVVDSKQFLDDHRGLRHRKTTRVVIFSTM